MNPLILIIDDDEKLSRLLSDYLNDFGFRTLTAAHPEAGLEKLREASPNLVILDVMMPDMNGFEVCKVIRRTSDVPIIMLTARGDLSDKVVGLELGADDYLAKPFEPRELTARIQSVLRRMTKTGGKDAAVYGRLRIDFSKRTASVDGVDADLTTNEFSALALLAVSPGKVFDRDEILQELRGMDCDAFNRSVDITMSRLRQKLDDDPKNPEFIKTVWGAGYVFIGQV